MLAAMFEGYGPIQGIVIVASRTHDTNTAYVDFESEAASQKVWQRKKQQQQQQQQQQCT
jgi:RNA recognition motif-containing protein